MFQVVSGSKLKIKRRDVQNPDFQFSFSLVTPSPERNPWIRPFAGSAPKVNEVYSGTRPILHLSVMEVCSVVFELPACLLSADGVLQSAGTSVEDLRGAVDLL